VKGKERRGVTEGEGGDGGRKGRREVGGEVNPLQKSSYGPVT